MDFFAYLLDVYLSLLWLFPHRAKTHSERYCWFLCAAQSLGHVLEHPRHDCAATASAHKCHECTCRGRSRLWVWGGLKTKMKRKEMTRDQGIRDLGERKKKEISGTWNITEKWKKKRRKTENKAMSSPLSPSSLLFYLLRSFFCFGRWLARSEEEEDKRWKRSSSDSMSCE